MSSSLINENDDDYEYQRISVGDVNSFGGRKTLRLKNYTAARRQTVNHALKKYKHRMSMYRIVVILLNTNRALLFRNMFYWIRSYSAFAILSKTHRVLSN